MCKNKDKEEKANDLYQDALESWAEYQETGEYVTWDEAKACLQAWDGVQKIMKNSRSESINPSA